ncbi:E3 ubiquitin-protein ligase AIRP1-like [Cornus florida]|uniref:E3 ubiquitin-protein ligase AIRP1-like n=1 Tax=Cornus florida TaxID=4283 RepID=UPI00289EB67D|nr:E3 ubiquitin-protein ligase AIRP1-like [Cornus florida]
MDWSLVHRSVPAQTFSWDELFQLGMQSLAMEIRIDRNRQTVNSCWYPVPYSQIQPDHDDDEADFDRKARTFFSCILSAEQIPEDEGMIDEMVSLARVICQTSGNRSSLLSAPVPSTVVEVYISNNNRASGNRASARAWGFDLEEVLNAFRPWMPSLEEANTVNPRVPLPRPTRKASIEALEKVVAIDNDGSSADQCVICLEEFRLGSEVLTRLPCSHVYHGDCIVNWLRRSQLCPVCRFQMPT